MSEHQQQRQQQQGNNDNSYDNFSTSDIQTPFVIHNLNSDLSASTNDLLGLFFPNANSSSQNVITAATDCNSLQSSQNQPLRNQQHSSPSEEDDEEINEQQLKQLPMKERRQIRNKISARNFRNRRKEYMAKLEGEIEQYRLQNNRLSVEVQWLKEMMQKLQQENDRLRLELLLCKNGIPIDAIDINTVNSTLNTTITGCTSNNTSNSTVTSNSRNNKTTPRNNLNNSCSVAGSTLQTPLTFAPTISPPHLSNFTRKTNTAAPVESSTVSPSQLLEDLLSCSNSNTTDSPEEQSLYLSHATVPDWDFGNVLSKEKDEVKLSKDLLEEKTNATLTTMHMYPLLAPAIMSIILHHILVLMATTTTTTFLDKDKRKEATQQIEADNVNTEDASHNENRLITTRETQDENNEGCPLMWLRRYLCKFILLCLLAKYPKLNRAVRTYLPVCRKYRIQV